MASSPSTEPGATSGPDPRPGGFEGRLWAAVDAVPDPHIPVSLVEMGMIYDIEASDGSVAVEMTYPCLGCPAYDMLQGDVRNALMGIDGVDSVEIDVTWDPPWSKDRLSAAAREKMHAAGIDL